MLNKMKKTKTAPPIYYRHSEKDFIKGKELSVLGIASGMLGTKKLLNSEKRIWEKLITQNWDEFNYESGLYFKRSGIDAFSTVPCSRAFVRDSIVNGFNRAGLIQIKDLISKKNNSISFAGKDKKYVKESTIIDTTTIKDYRVKSIVICDDFTNSGKTLFGLHSLLACKNFIKSQNIKLFLYSPGISNYLG